MANIKHEIVFTCDRHDIPFSQDFEAYNFLQETFFHFPQIGKFTSSFITYYRLGYIPDEFINTYGLFVKGVSLGDFTTGMGQIKFIPANDSKTSQSNHYIQIDFSEGFSDPVYHVSAESFGYTATLQVMLEFIKEEEDKQKALHEVIEYVDKEGDIENITVKNEGDENFGIKPFIVSADLKSDKFIESAGNKTMFKIGELIGEQMEMYQEEDRILPVEQWQCRSYYREIDFEIPEGYKALNLDDLKLDVKKKNGDDVELQFVSDYSVDGNKVHIILEQFYKVLDFPVNEFKEYQDVVNAAADFNKIVLIFEPI